MMSNLDNLSGEYKVRGKTLTTQDNGKPVFIITTRTHLTPGKAPKFLLALDEKQARTYVSSLYPSAADTTYSFDYAGVKYVLTYTSPETVCIEPKTGKV